MAKSVFQVLMEIEGDQKVKSALGDIGKAAGLAGAALTAFSGAVAKTAADYEFSLAKVGTLATEATGSIAEFDQAIFQLSDRMDGAISANEAAAASYDVLSAGYSDQTDVLAILEESQKTAIGGYSDLATISDASTTVMNAFGDALGENLDVTQKVKLVTDGMIATQNLGKITAGEYARQIGSVASTASAAGVSLEEVNAAVATATAQGLRVSSTFSGLNQVLAALMKPTSEAKVKAAELGIEFSATALQSKGLAGVLMSILEAQGGLSPALQDLAASGNLTESALASLAASGDKTAENMTMLFGTVEAVKVLMPLVSNDAATFNKNLAAMGDTAGTVDKAFEMMSETTTVKVQNSLKKLNNAFIQLGRGVLIAVSPVIDALDLLVTNFNKLPAPLVQVIGAITAVTGVTLTLAGGILLATSAIAAMSGSIATFIGAFTAAKVAMVGFAAYNGITLVALKALALQFALIVAAIGSVALAYDALREKGTQFDENTKAIRNSIRDAREELAKLNKEQQNGSEGGTDNGSNDIEANRKWYDWFGEEQASRLSNYRVNVGQTTEAVAELGREFKRYGNSQEEVAIKQTLFQNGLKQIDDAINKLDENELGTKVYNELRENLVKSRTALEENAKANGLSALSAEEAALAAQTQAEAQTQVALTTEEATAKFEAYRKSVEDYLAVLETQKETAILGLDTEGLGIEEKLTKELELTQEYNAKILEQKEALAAQTQLSDSERLKQQSEINKLLAEEAKKVFDTEEKLRDLANKNSLDSFDTERANAETLFANKQILSKDYYDYLIQLLNEELTFKLSLIDEELKGAKKGTSEYATLQKERSLAILQTTKEGVSIHEKYNQEIADADQKALEAHQSYLEDKQKATEDSLNKAIIVDKSNLENFKKNNQERILSDESYQESYKKLVAEQYESEVALLDHKLTLADQDSAEYASLQAEKITLTQAYQEQIKQLETDTLNFKLSQIDLELKAQKNANQEILENRRLANDQLSNQSQFLGGLSGIIGKISSNLEKDNLTLTQRNQLTAIGRSVLNQSAALGLKVNANLSVEQNLKLALNALELRKLDIQKQQLQLQQEIIKAESESAALDLSGNIEIAQQKLTDPSKTDLEKQQLQQEIDLNTKKLDLLNKQTEAKLKSNEASQTLLDLEKSLAITTQSIANNTPSLSTTKTSPTPRTSEGESTKVNLEKTATNTQESKTKLASIDTSARDIPVLSQKLTRLDNNDTILNSTLNTINGSIVNNGQILKTIKASLDGLPSKIASSLPRTSPTPSASSR